MQERIKTQAKYVYTENNYIEDPSYAGIDFQMGYGTSSNDTINSPTVGSAKMIAVSGDNCQIIGAALICKATNQSVADGIYINNVSGSNAIKSVVIEKVKTQGLRYPIY